MRLIGFTQKKGQKWLINATLPFYENAELEMNLQALFDRF